MNRWLAKNRWAAVINKAIEQYDATCDPAYLHAVVNHQLSYVKSKAKRNQLFIQLSVILADAGNIREAAEMLETVDIHFNPDLPTKFTYYHNLAAIYLEMDKLETVAYLLKMESFVLFRLRGKPKNKAIELYHRVLAEYHTKNKEYALAEALLNSICYEGLTLHAKVQINLNRVKILVETGRREEAALYRDFVIQNGNKLHAVQCARNLFSGE